MYGNAKYSVLLGCGGTLTSPEGMIMSPGYPTSYGTNAECVWRIGVSQGSRVLFAFADLDMETQTRGCSFDYVEVSLIFLLALRKHDYISISLRYAMVEIEEEN